MQVAPFFSYFPTHTTTPIGGKAIACLFCCPCGTSPFPHGKPNLMDTVSSSLLSSSTYPIYMLFPMFTSQSNNLPSTTHWVAPRMWWFNGLELVTSTQKAGVEKVSTNTCDKISINLCSLPNQWQMWSHHQPFLVQFLIAKCVLVQCMFVQLDDLDVLVMPHGMFGITP